MKGRKPKPTAEKLLTGNPGKRPLNDREPQYGPLPVDVPIELTDPEAVAEWQRTVVPAITKGQIQTTDRVLAIAHCELWATWRSQVALAARNPHVVATKTGHPMPNPARGMANTTLKLLGKVDSELGFSPTSRSRIAVGGESEADPLAEFLGASEPQGIAARTH